MPLSSKKIFVMAVAIPAGALCIFLLTMALRPTSDIGLDRRRHVPRGERPDTPNGWIVSRLEKDAYLQDIATVTKQITLKPTPGKEPDSVMELAILNVAPESPMYAAGFRKDDRILKVNGTPIGTLGRATNLIHEIKACSHLTVQVQRGDQTIDYQFSFE